MTKDEQARQRLVEMALSEARLWDGGLSDYDRGLVRGELRQRAGFRDPSKGHWCAAGLTAAMEDSGLLVPEPGTPARRGAIALLDYMLAVGCSDGRLVSRGRSLGDICEFARPGDIIAWKQNREPQEWAGGHAFATQASAHSLCGMHRINLGLGSSTKRCSSCIWETRKGHVALIVKVDDISLTTVGWNEGQSPGRVMMRWLWRDPARRCGNCGGSGRIMMDTAHARVPVLDCEVCRKTGRVRPSETVLARKQGLLYGIARPVAE